MLRRVLALAADSGVRTVCQGSEFALGAGEQKGVLHEGTEHFCP